LWFDPFEASSLRFNHDGGVAFVVQWWQRRCVRSFGGVVFAVRSFWSIVCAIRSFGGIVTSEALFVRCNHLNALSVWRHCLCSSIIWGVVTWASVNWRRCLCGSIKDGGCTTLPRKSGWRNMSVVIRAGGICHVSGTARMLWQASAL
jgi:hypothetical protein